jgi:Spy/CpxP family protein refolding chaperone
MRIGLWCAAVLGTGLLVGAGALHGRGGHGPLGGMMAKLHEAHGDQIKSLHAELNLSEAQRKAVHETIKAHVPEIAAAIKPVLEAKRALHDAVLADNPGEAAIRNAAADVGSSIGDAAVVMAAIKVEVFKNAQLTPEQKQIVMEIKAEIETMVDTFINKHLAAHEAGEAPE